MYNKSICLLIQIHNLVYNLVMRIAVLKLKCHIRENEWISLVYAQFKAVHDTSSNHCKHFGAGTYETLISEGQMHLHFETHFHCAKLFIHTKHRAHPHLKWMLKQRPRPRKNLNCNAMLPFGSFWDNHRNSKDCMMGEKVHKIMTFCTICQMGGMSLKFPLPRDSK